MKTIIKLSLEDQVLKATESPVIASGGVNENRIEFTFSEHWDNYTKVAVFSRADDTEDEEPIAIELLNNSCDVPFEVTEEEGTVLIGVFGVLGNITRTSINMEYKIVKGSLLNGRAPAAPTKNIYQQLLEKYTQIQTEIERSSEDIEALKSGFEKLYDDYAGKILKSSLGESIIVTDSAKRRLQGLKLFGKTVGTEKSETVVVGTGKNILPAPYADGDTTISGITFTNTDGKLYLRGTATAAITYDLGTIELEAGTYTLSRVEALTYDMFGIMWNISAEGITVPIDYSTELSFSFTLSEKTYVSISFDTWGGEDGVNGYLEIMLEDGGSVTEWEAYTEITETKTWTEFSNVGDSGSVRVKISGKNLFTLPYYHGGAGTSRTHLGITYTVNNDGSIYAKGTPTGSSYFIVSRTLPLPSGYWKGTKEGYTLSPELLCNNQSVSINFSVGSEVDATIYPQIELGAVATAFESPKEEQILTVSTPNGLASVGDVCDEIDFARGVIIQRIARGEEYTVLETPIETPLSAEEIEAFKYLYTHYPNTSILNDNGATMEVEYVADTKIYIDNKFAELASAIANT